MAGKTGATGSLSHMFYDCTSLTSIGFSGFDTSGVTDMDSMFYNCYYLASLDVSGFDTSFVTHMGDMFSGRGSVWFRPLPFARTDEQEGYPACVSHVRWHMT